MQLHLRISSNYDLEMWCKIVSILVIISYTKKFDGRSLNKEGTATGVKTTIDIRTSQHEDDEQQYNICNLQVISQPSTNGTNTTVFVGNNSNASEINEQSLRQELFKALLPYTGTPILLIRVKVIKNDTGKGLILFDVSPTNNGEVISTDVIQNAVRGFCYPISKTSTTEKQKEQNSEKYQNTLTLISSSGVKDGNTSPVTLALIVKDGNKSQLTLGIGVGLPVLLLCLLAVLFLVYKKKCFKRNKVAADGKSNQNLTD